MSAEQFIGLNNGQSVQFKSGLTEENLETILADNCRFAIPVKPDATDPLKAIAPAAANEEIALLVMSVEDREPTLNTYNTRKVVAKFPKGGFLVKYNGDDPALGADTVGTTVTFGEVGFTAEATTECFVWAFDSTAKTAIIYFS